ncbi:MAG: hypothetical protein A3J27_10340 [Candidatus Tectomicrobia bacterium RIFCSPLOWO2_12_FULL_69_37]|nr:MAG: hypothetical protein A3I72_12710 [Candidatus Tectomicrobia bacterium RIFCSPLOWO2_02_FULL_70_19]OGL67459.1 MAG: hypothetical protein A3J27_10340 [Candidatus Tectomicrobia bacterium RIFCSPLOWO2_12_FULL_69_37]
MDSPLLSPREKAAVLWAGHVTRNTAKSRDDVFAEVSRRFSRPELVELTMVITYFNMRNRFQDSLRIPLEAQESIDRAKDSRRQDAGDLVRYLSGLVESWPRTFPGPAE